MVGSRTFVGVVIHNIGVCASLRPVSKRGKARESHRVMTTIANTARKVSEEWRQRLRKTLNERRAGEEHGCESKSNEMNLFECASLLRFATIRGFDSSLLARSLHLERVLWNPISKIDRFFFRCQYFAVCLVRSTVLPFILLRHERN